jgi:alpha-tubulin suppressor-like RCC1 family protein
MPVKSGYTKMTFNCVTKAILRNPVNCFALSLLFCNTLPKVVQADDVGTVVCWGDNDNQQCGTVSEWNNAPTYRQYIWTKGAVGPCKAVAAGKHFTVALQADGTVVGWGNNALGQCGDVETVEQEDEELGIHITAYWSKPSVGKCKAIAAGDDFVVALREDGCVVGWGYNGLGQCGDIPHYDDECNIMYWTKSDVGCCKAIAAHFDHTLVIRETDGIVWGWGRNRGSDDPGYGICGASNERHGGGISQDDSSDGAYWVKTSLGRCVAVAAGGYYSLALQEDGTVVAWGTKPLDDEEYPYAWPQIAPSIGSCTAISGGYGHCSALGTSKNVMSWGSSEDDCCGKPIVYCNYFCGSSYCEQVGSITHIGVYWSKPLNCKAISSSYRWNLGLQEDGTVVGWGHFGMSIADVARYDGPVCENEEGLYSVKTGIGACAAISAGFNHAVAIQVSCPGDLDGSGEVDAGDLGLFLLYYGPCHGDCGGADLDGSGEVDSADLGLLILNTGPCP